MSINSEMSPGIVMPPPTDLSDHWSKVARERVRSQEHELRLRDFFAAIPMNLFSNDASPGQNLCPIKHFRSSTMVW